MKDQRDQRSYHEAWGVSAPFVGEDGHLLARPWIGVSVVIALVYLGFKSAVMMCYHRYTSIDYSNYISTN